MDALECTCCFFFFLLFDNFCYHNKCDDYLEWRRTLLGWAAVVFICGCAKSGEGNIAGLIMPMIQCIEKRGREAECSQMSSWLNVKVNR